MSSFTQTKSQAQALQHIHYSAISLEITIISENRVNHLCKHFKYLRKHVICTLLLLLYLRI